MATTKFANSNKLTAVYNHWTGLVCGLDCWTGLLDWTGGLDWWTELLDWTVGLDCWTGLLDWTGGLDWWTGLVDWTGGLTLKIIFMLFNKTYSPVEFVSVPHQSWNK